MSKDSNAIDIEVHMPIGILFWVLLILCVIACFTGYAVGGIAASTGIILILLGLLGWKTFGPPLQ